MMMMMMMMMCVCVCVVICSAIGVRKMVRTVGMILKLASNRGSQRVAMISTFSLVMVRK